MNTQNIDLPETYKNFDDGKVKPSRMYDVTLTEIIPFKEASSSLISLWKEEAGHCDWLYTKTTDYFLLGKLHLIDETEDVIYVRALNNGWFSLGYWAGRLDLDGSLEKQMNEDIIYWRGQGISC